jgi:hypothetical protein
VTSPDLLTDRVGERRGGLVLTSWQKVRRWRLRRGPSDIVCTFGFDLFRPDAVTTAVKQRLEGIYIP